MEKALPVDHFVRIFREMLGIKGKQVALNRPPDYYCVLYSGLSIGIPMAPFQHIKLVKAIFVEGLRLPISAQNNF